MGFFDLLRNRKTREEEELKRELAEFMQDDQRPNAIHYSLAHYAIRQVAFEDPMLAIAVFSTEGGPKMLTQIYDDVRDSLPKEKANFKASDVKAHPAKIKDYPAVIFEFPKAEKITEAYFTAIVVLADLGQMSFEQASKSTMRYFTLEKTFPLENPATVFGEWTETAHLNKGEGPKPNLDDFIKRIEQELSKK